MPDLHGWITQQIDRVEERARMASANLYNLMEQVDYEDRGVERDEQHIELHLPPAVLRRCAADRKILDHHSPVGGGWPGHYVCAGCGYDGGYCPEPYTEHVNDCPTLLALAKGYGLTEEQRAALERPEMEQPPHKPGFAGMPDDLVDQMLRASLATVPVALRGPNWKARP